MLWNKSYNILNKWVKIKRQINNSNIMNKMKLNNNKSNMMGNRKAL